MPSRFFWLRGRLSLGNHRDRLHWRDGFRNGNGDLGLVRWSLRTSKHGATAILRVAVGVMRCAAAGTIATILGVIDWRAAVGADRSHRCFS